MKRATRRSSIFLPPPAAAGEEKRIAGNSFDTKFSLPAFVKRVEKLTENQRDAIARTGFGSLLSLHNQMISKVLLGELIERCDCERRAFMFPQGEVTFTVQDVALILGLRVVGKSVVLDDAFSDLEREYGATPKNRKINISSIEDRLESIGRLVNDDFVRSFLLFTFGIFLFPNSNGKVDSRYLNLLEDVDRAHEYAWGEAVLEDLFLWIRKRKEENVRLVGGCLLLLQVWSYEHIDIGRPNLLVSGQFPRASRWESIRSSYQRQWLSTKINKLEEDQITWVLHPTAEESEIDVVKQFLEAKQAGDPVLVEPSPTSSSSNYEGNNSVDSDSEREADPSHSPSKGDLSAEVQTKQEEVTSGPLDALLNAPVSCSDNKDTAEPRLMDDLENAACIKQGFDSEASGVSSEMLEFVPDTPEMSNGSSRGNDLKGENRDCLQSSSCNLASTSGEADQVKEDQSLQVNELKKENAILRQQLLLIPQLQDENTKLKAEVEELRTQVEGMNATFIDIERGIFELGI